MRQQDGEGPKAALQGDGWVMDWRVKTREAVNQILANNYPFLSIYCDKVNAMYGSHGPKLFGGMSLNLRKIFNYDGLFSFLFFLFSELCEGRSVDGLVITSPK